MVAKNCLKLDFQGIKFIRIMQLSPGVLPSHKCFNEYISPFIRIYHLLFMIGGHTFPTSTKNDQFLDLPANSPSAKMNNISIILKTIESANIGIITRPPSVWTSEMYGSLNDFK